MIGRLDGATAIMDLLLNSRRIGESGLTNAHLKALLAEVSAGADVDGDLPSTEAAPSEEELGSWKTAFTRLAHSLILCEELPQVGAAVAAEVEQDWSKSTPAPQGDITLANARAAFGTYLGSIARAGGTKEVVTAEFGSPKGSRLVADAGVVATNVLGSDRTGFPGFVSMAVGAARGAVRVAGFAVHQATGGRLQRSVFIGVTALAGAALAWAVAKSGSTSTGAAPAGGSSFKESVVAASLTILTVAVVLGLRPFASRALSMICGLATAIAFSLMVGWLWTGKARPSCDLNTPCGTLGNTDFIWLLLGIVALSVAVGWVATVSLSARLQSLATIAVVAYAVGIAVVLKA
jgi:hypothetical protein